MEAEPRPWHEQNIWLLQMPTYIVYVLISIKSLLTSASYKPTLQAWGSSFSNSIGFSGKAKNRQVFVLTFWQLLFFTPNQMATSKLKECTTLWSYLWNIK